MKKAIEFSVKHPVSALMYFSLAIFLGAISVFCMNTSLLPKTRDRFILASTNYDGVRAEEIRKLVTIPLEQALASLKDVKNIESVSRDGSCAIKIELKWGADIDAALLECAAILEDASESLPDDCPAARAKKLGGFASEISVCLLPKENDIFAATEFAENEFKSKLLSFEETAYVEVIGGKKKEIKAIVDSSKAAFYGLGLDEIARRLNLSNYDYPAGTIQDGDDEILLKTDGTYKSFKDILETPLKTSVGSLKLGDIARVEKLAQKTEEFVYCNGERCAQVKVVCKKNKNPLLLSAKVKRLLAQVNDGEKGFEAFLTHDGADEIWLSLKNLAFSALAGVAASFFLILLFFRSVKIAAVIASVIPLSVLFTFFVLLCFGKSVNVISLAGITLCLGMIIDNSIVAMESVLDEAKERKDFSKAILDAVEKISLSNSASTLTTIIVFAPLFFIGGIIGELFTDLGIAVLSGMAFSLLFSFSALPAFCVLFLREEAIGAKKIDLSFLQKRYEGIVERVRGKAFLCPAAALAFFAASLLILLPLKKEMQPKGRADSFVATALLDGQMGIDALERKAKAVSKSVMELKSVSGILTSGGLSKDRPELLAKPEENARRLVLKIKAVDAKKAKAECERLFAALGLDFAFEDAEDLFSERIGIKDLTLFAGQNPRELFLESLRFFGNGFFPNERKSLKTFKADKNLLEKAGITPLDLSAALKSSFDGTKAFPFYENGKEETLRVQFEQNEFSPKKNLSALRLPAKKGMVFLSSLGGWEDEDGEAVLYRLNGNDAKIVKDGCLSKNAPLSQVPKKRIVKTKKKEIIELLKNAFFLLLTAFLLLYCVLGAQSESFKTPLVYLIAVPPAFFGAALFLAVFRSSLNINSIMAFVTLFGTSVNCSIILRQCGTKGFSSVLITTATSLASLAPFAFDPFNLNPQSSLALAMTGGLLFSAAASLILVPIATEGKNGRE